MTVKLDGKPVPQSPIRVEVEPGSDLSKVKLQDFETEVFVDCTNEFVVDATALPNNEEATLECFIEDPNGQPIEIFVNKIQPLDEDGNPLESGDEDENANGGGLFHVSYVPSDEGNHDIHLKYDGDDLPDSPFPVTASYGCDPNRVKVKCNKRSINLLWSGPLILD